MKNLIIKIKPLYKSLKWIKRKFNGTPENRRCYGGGELNLLLSYAKKDGLFLEIGSAFGQTTKSLSEKGFVVTIDPFILDDRGQIMGEYFEDITSLFLKNIKGENVCFFPLKSENVEKIWGQRINKKFDLIFIDGLHTYDQVKKDYAWIKHLKIGGYVAFHDTNFPQIAKFIQEKPMKELEFIEEFETTKVFRKSKEFWRGKKR